MYVSGDPTGLDTTMRRLHDTSILLHANPDSFPFGALSTVESLLPKPQKIPIPSRSPLTCITITTQCGEEGVLRFAAQRAGGTDSLFASAAISPSRCACVYTFASAEMFARHPIATTSNPVSPPLSRNSGEPSEQSSRLTMRRYQATR